LPADFYNTTETVASLVYEALWQPNGLATSLCFNDTQLAGTENVYSWDTGTEVPAERSWVREADC